MASPRAQGISDGGAIGDILTKGEVSELGVGTGETADFQTEWKSPETLGLVVSQSVRSIVKLTQAEYDALTPDESTLYVVVG